MNYLLTMAHGAEHYRQEAVYLLLSWLRQRDQRDQREPAASACTALVATDRPESFVRYLGERPDIAYLPLDTQQLLVWRGSATAYVHRIKPQLIAHAAKTVGAGAGDTLLFVDSDTAFLADPAPLFTAIAQGDAVLHAREGTIAGNRSHSRSQARLFHMAKGAQFDFGGQGRQRLSLDLPLWNSGAVGLRCDEVEPVMAATLALTDQIQAVLALPAAEQVALSAVLGAADKAVVAAEPYLLHYHVFKEFRSDIASWLDHHADATPSQLVALSAEIDPGLRIQPKLAFNRRPKWQRQLLKRLGRGWRRLPYPWQQG